MTADEPPFDSASAAQAATPRAKGFIEVEFTVEPNYAGWRLDRYLCEKIRRLSRSRVQRIIERDLVRESEQQARLKPSSLVRPGLTFRLRRRVHDEPVGPEDVVERYRDDWLFVLDYPAGRPVTPLAEF